MFNVSMVGRDDSQVKKSHYTNEVMESVGMRHPVGKLIITQYDDGSQSLDKEGEIDVYSLLDTISEWVDNLMRRSVWR